ncbi:MAG: glycosyltransferase family 2 protein [Candidatus Binatia bacterium]
MPYLVGTNMAFPAEVFARFGGFSSELERRGALSPLGMEDVELCHRVVRGGGVLMYEPRAVVHHFVPDDRARLWFLIRRSYADGRSLVRYQKITGDLDREGSRPRLLFQNLIELPIQVLRGNRVASARSIVQAARHLGYLREAHSPTH